MITLDNLNDFRLISDGGVLIISSPTCVTCKTLKRILSTKEETIRPQVFNYELSTGEDTVTIKGVRVSLSKVPTVLYVEPHRDTVIIHTLSLNIEKLISLANNLHEQHKEAANET